MTKNKQHTMKKKQINNHKQKQHHKIKHIEHTNT